MTTQQSIVVTVLWVGVGGLFCLVLLLYRAVDRAYRQDARSKQGGLLPGAETPPVEILTGAGIDFLDFPALESPYLLGFVSGGCDECLRLYDTLVAEPALSGSAALVIIDGQPFEREENGGGSVEIHVAAHPPDIQRAFGVTALPLVYIMRERMVLSVGVASTSSEIRTLVEEARKRDNPSEVTSDSPIEQVSPVRVVMADGSRESRHE